LYILFHNQKTRFLPVDSYVSIICKSVLRAQTRAQHRFAASEPILAACWCQQRTHILCHSNGLSINTTSTHHRNIDLAVRPFWNLKLSAQLLKGHRAHAKLLGHYMQRQVEVIAQLFCAHVAAPLRPGGGNDSTLRLPANKHDSLGTMGVAINPCRLCRARGEALKE